MNSLTPPHSVVILGAGIMGCGIAAGFLKANWTVQVFARRPAQHESVRQRIRTLLDDLSPQSTGDTAGRTSLGLVDSLTAIDWQTVDLVIETVREDLTVKQALFEQLDALVPPHVPVASNTSGFRITDIASERVTRSRMAHAHFFMPAHQMPLVELAGADFTDTSTIERLHELFVKGGRIPVRVASDIPGLLANRMQHALMREAWSMLEQGVATADDIDTAVRYGFGFRYVAAGPLLQKEFSGLDTQALSAAAIYPSLCNASEPASLLREKVAHGHLGIKTGQGLRNWPADRIAHEQQRYSEVLAAALSLLMQDRVDGDDRVDQDP